MTRTLGLRLGLVTAAMAAAVTLAAADKPDLSGRWQLGSDYIDIDHRDPILVDVVVPCLVGVLLMEATSACFWSGCVAQSSAAGADHSHGTQTV